MNAHSANCPGNFATRAVGDLYRDPEAIDRAVTHLQMLDIVGRLDDLDGFVRDIRQTVGVRLRVGHKNKTSHNANLASRGSLTQAQLDQVQEICAPDIEVWQRLFPT